GLLLVVNVDGSNSNAPMPLLPIKQSSSTGFIEFSGRPFRASHILMSSLPYLSGNESANNPGNPLKVGVPRSSGNENTRLLKDIRIGATSRLPVLNFGSYSKYPSFWFSSQATAPTRLPHSVTKAVVTIRHYFDHLDDGYQMPFCASFHLP